MLVGPWGLGFRVSLRVCGLYCCLGFILLFLGLGFRGLGVWGLRGLGVEEVWGSEHMGLGVLQRDLEGFLWGF